MALNRRPHIENAQNCQNDAAQIANHAEQARNNRHRITQNRSQERGGNYASKQQAPPTQNHLHRLALRVDLLHKDKLRIKPIQDEKSAEYAD